MVKKIFFILDAAPTDAQLEHCQGCAKAASLDLWICELAAGANISLFGDRRDALTASQARAISISNGWRANPPGFVE